MNNSGSRLMRPGLWLMNQLKYPGKCLLILALFSLPLGFTLHSFVTEINGTIEFAKKEKIGVEGLHRLCGVFQSLLDFRGAVRLQKENAAIEVTPEKILPTVEAQIKTYSDFENEWAEYLNLGDGWTNFQIDWTQYLSQLSKKTSEESFAAVNTLIENLMNHMIHVGDRSNLILDPDLDSYYLMDTTVLKLPYLLNIVGKSRVLSSAASKKSNLEPYDLFIFNHFSQEIKKSQADLLRNFKVIYRENSNLKHSLQNPFTEALRALAQQQTLNESIAQEAKTTEIAQDYWNKGSEVIRVTAAFYESVVKDLDQTLDRRIDKFQARKNFVLALTFFTILGVLYLVCSFYVGVMRTIDALDKAGKQMLQGNMDQQVDLSTKDELGIVIQSFNTIAKRLRKEYHQALAENRRAAEAEEKLKTMVQIADAANRAKSDFLATMSHEIRTPMNAILGMSELLGETVLDHDQQEYLKTLNRNGEALLSLINDILDLAKIESGKFELEKIEFNLEELIEGVGDMMALRAQQKGLEFVLHTAPEIPKHVLGDPGRLRQVLLNLISNALKFTEQGEILVEVSAEGKHVTFSVQDTGIGIPAEKRKSLFQSFSQVDSSITRKYGGTGLGLSICKKIVESMGGSIHVSTEPGKGSRFYFRVPLEKQTDFTAEADPDAGFLKGKRVLVVDDNETNRLILKKILHAYQADSQEAAGGSEGLEKITSAHADNRPFDLILLDYHMPGMDGLTLAGKLQSQNLCADSTIIMLSSESRQQAVELSKALSIADFLIKPVKKQLLAASLKKVLTDKKKASQQMSRGALRTPAALPPVKLSGKFKILLVEDRPDNSFVIQSYLKDTLYETELAENGKEACEKFDSHPYDLVLMDLHMPVMDGYEATRRIRSIEKKKGLETTPVIALSASALKEEMSKSFDAGCQEHIAKPISKKQLLELLEKYAAQKEQKDQVRAA